MSAVEFLFDFGSPNAYLSHCVIPGIERRTGVKFVYVPILLGGVFKATNNQSPFEAFKDIKNKLDYEEIETQRFIERHGIANYKPNPHFPVNTLNLMRCAIAAQQLGVFERYVSAIFAAMWADEKKMDDPSVFASTLQGAGLDADSIMGLAQDAAVKSRLVENTTFAVERGVFGAPTFFVDGDIYFGKDRLRDVEMAMIGKDLSKDGEKLAG